ncbi:hypothetical protein TD95_004172 [Thielaviopsis punctulata]|uniref:Uncharacterized protein n=1 Tax=Thielaviopsis punctulata TaxID=72032 RepID=A0A0F4ZGI2_9PEZI|nr:hypothetical protein TD95_004172 [Thielaviopsis punctulata]
MEPTVQPEPAAPAEPTKKPFALPLALALPKMYLYGSAFMPQDVNEKSPEESSQKNDKKRDKHMDNEQEEMQ